MANINEITNAAGYLGSKELGGFVPDAIAIDSRPLEILAQYTVAYNKTEREQRQKDAEGQARELAGIASIDFSKIDDKWRQPIAEKFDKLTEFVKANPNVFNYQKNPQGFLEYSRMKNELGQAVASGKANQIILEKRKVDAIASGDNIELKKVLEDEIEADKLKTGLFDTMPAEEKYTIDFPNLVNDKAVLELEVLKSDPNNKTTFEYKLPDARKLNAQALTTKFNITDKEFDYNSDAYKGADENTKKRMLGEFNRKKYLTKNGWVATAQTATQVIKNEAYLTDGKVDLDKLAQDQTTKPLAELVLNTNRYLANKKAEIEAGVYTDKSGNKLDASEYYPIKFEDGFDDAEIARIALFANAANEEKKVKNQYTGDATSILKEKMGNAVTMRGQDKTAQTAANELAEKKAARIAKGQPPLPDGDAADKGNIIYSVNGYIGGNKNKKIVGGKVQDSKGNFDPTFSKEVKINADATGSYIQSWYNKYNFQSGDSKSPKVDVTDGKLTAQFKNGIIVGIKSTNGAFITIDEFQKISDANSQSKENKYISETQVGSVPSGGDGELP